MILTQSKTFPIDFDSLMKDALNVLNIDSLVVRMELVKRMMKNLIRRMMQTNWLGWKNIIDKNWQSAIKSLSNKGYL